MLLDRQGLIDHLERIYVGGHIPEVIFDKSLATVARTPENDFFVMAPNVDGVEFDLKFGIRGIDVMLNWLSYTAAEQVDLSVEKNGKADYLVLKNPEDALDVRNRLCTDPRVVSSAPSEKEASSVATLIEKNLDGNQSIVLEPERVERLLKRYASQNRPEFITVSINGKKVSFVIGTVIDNAQVGGFVTTRSPGKTFDLILNGQKLATVLGLLNPEEENFITFSGEHPAVVGIKAGDYLYALNSLEPSA